MTKKQTESAGLIIPGSGCFSLMRSQDRIEKLSDGWFKDRFLTEFYGKDFVWSPPSLEKHINWQDAEEYAAKYGRQGDDFELSTLIDRSKCNPAIIDAAKVLELKTDDWYWTKTPVAGGSSNVWCVGFRYGSVSFYYKGDKFYVRPVRSSQ